MQEPYWMLKDGVIGSKQTNSLVSMYSTPPAFMKCCPILGKFHTVLLDNPYSILINDCITFDAIFNVISRRPVHLSMEFF